MKNLIKILFIFFLISSCATNKNGSTGPVDFKSETEINKDNPRKEKKKQARKERRETKKLNRLYKKNKIKDIELDGVPDYVDADSSMIQENHMFLENNVEERLISHTLKIEKHTKKENLEIIDKTTTIKKQDNSSKGTIAYSVPQEMQVGKSYQIKLRISKQTGKEINKTLIVGEREIPIADPSIDSKVTLENIRVERTMTAELLSEDGAFKVTKLNTDKQVLEDESYTEWGWIVTPQKSGKTYLKLVIKIKVKADGETYIKDIVVFDKNIKVKANASLEVKSWFSQYWQWLMTTIIIPVFLFYLLY